MFCAGKYRLTGGCFAKPAFDNHCLSAGRADNLRAGGQYFHGGAIVQWLRDALCLIEKAGETAALAEAADPASNVVLVPAFTGLCTPLETRARAALFNMTRDSGKAEIVRAALEAVSLQTDDLLRAINDDMAQAGLSVPPRLRVDGGMVANDWFVQNLADLCACPIDRPEVIETTAAGAAMLAMVKLGWFDSLADFCRRLATRCRV